MDKNKIITILVALCWLVVVVLKIMGVITLGQFRIILLILVVLYAAFYYTAKRKTKD